jgi:hypothetical protein
MLGDLLKLETATETNKTDNCKAGLSFASQLAITFGRAWGWALAQAMLTRVLFVQTLKTAY